MIRRLQNLFVNLLWAVLPWDKLTIPYSLHPSCCVPIKLCNPLSGSPGSHNSLVPDIPSVIRHRTNDTHLIYSTMLLLNSSTLQAIQTYTWVYMHAWICMLVYVCAHWYTQKKLYAYMGLYVYLYLCILDLECPGNHVNACWWFISEVYDSREKLCL